MRDSGNHKDSFSRWLTMILIGTASLSSGCAVTDQRLTNLEPYEFLPVSEVEPLCPNDHDKGNMQNESFEYQEVCERLKLNKQSADTSQPKRILGLALSGGGNKSAPFEIGVLAGLEDIGLLEKVDYISSVSGGSYAAMYFYSHLLAQRNPDKTDEGVLTRKTMFLDCLPSKYASIFSQASPPEDWSVDRTEGICPDPIGQKGRYWPLSPEADPAQDDPLREASHLRGSQPLFDSAWAYNKYSGTWEDPRVLSESGGKIGINIFALGVPNFFFNTVFDTRLDLGYIKHAYDSAITRTYGETANDLALEPAGAIRTSGNPASKKRLTFHNLLDLYEYSNGPACPVEHATDGLCHTPFWIINATAGTSRGSFPMLEFSPYTAQTNGFEFTAFGYGSSLYGRRAWNENNSLEPTLSIDEAVGASSAFLDSQQRQIGGPWSGPALNIGVLKLANLEWGTDIPNYHDRTRAAYLAHKVIHDLMPWPSYFFNYDKERNDALDIHLSDGGMNEDLGAAALLRRHVTDIIVVDASTDKDYTLDDLCVLSTQLQNDPDNPRGVYIDLPGQAKHLMKQPDSAQTSDPFGIKQALWQPVIRGWVCKLDGSACSDASADARLYIIKPAVNFSAAAPGGITLSEARTNALEHRLRYADCAYSSNSTDAGYPCEVVGYLADPVTDGFPQDDLYATALASNAYIFGAYKELGRFYARHVQVDGLAGLGNKNQW
jgi:hypothetical protein